MKNLFLLAFVILLSCSNKEQNYISIEQTMSDNPISLALDNDTVKYMDIPLAFLMSKTSSKRGRIQRANALRRKVIKSFRKNTQKEYKNLIFLLVED